MTSKLIDLNLNKILDKGLSGELESLTQEDWLLIDMLTNQACKLNYEKGINEGYRKGCREGHQEKGEEV